MGMTIKITDPTGKAQGRKAGVTFNAGVGYSETPLNEGQLAGFNQWGYKVEGIDDSGKEAMKEAAKSLGPTTEGSGDAALKQATHQAMIEQRTVFNVTGGNPAPVPAPTAASKGGK